MKSKKNLFDIFINTLLCISMSFSLIYALTDSLHFDEYSAATLIFYISVFSALFSIFLFNKITIITSAVLLGIASPMAILELKGNKNYAGLLDVQDYITWLEGYINGYYESDKNYEFITVVLLCISITLLVSIFTCRWFNFPVILAGGASLFVCQWIMDYFTSYMSFYVFLFTILIYYFRFIHSRKLRKSPNNYSSQAVFTLQIAPLPLIVIMVAYFMPSRTEPMEWKWLSKNVNAIVDYFNDKYISVKRFDYFSVASSGFGDSGKLGGIVDLDKTHVLSVDSPRPLYLKASVYPTYTGYSWIGSNSNIKPFSNDEGALQEDLEEMQTGMRILSGGDDEYLDKYFNDDHLEVTFENLRTKSLFIPSFTYSIDISDSHSNELFIDDYGTVSVGKTARKGFTYTIDSYSPDLIAEGFGDILRKSRQGLYKSIITQIIKNCRVLVLGKDMFGNPLLYEQNISDGHTGYYRVAAKDTFEETKKAIEDSGDKLIVIEDEVLDDATASKYFDYSSKIYKEIKIEGQENPLIIYNIEDLQSIKKNILAFLEKAGHVRTKYLQLPDNLPSRVKELALTITSAYDNDYDKAKAIEQFFSANNYTYTLSPSRTPRGRDFVDYFLFDSKEGYCTYYASAMTILLRSAGIPARYVEGYIMPASPEEGTTYKVTNEQAHAWVEAYFEGYGWLQFEPTTPFTSILYRDKDSAEAFYNSFNGNQEMLDYLSRMGIFGRDNAPVFINGSTGLSEDEKSNKYFIIAFVAAVLLLLTMIVIINAFRHRVMLFRAKKSNPRDSVLDLYKYYLKILSALKLELEPGETPYQFSRRVDSYLIFYNSADTFKDITDIFVRARYGNEDISVKDRATVYDFYIKLRDNTKKEMGNLIYFIKMYILGKL